MKLTFDELKGMEPKLGELEAECRATAAGPRFCANAVWYGYEPLPGIKPRLLKLIGWERGVIEEPRPAPAGGFAFVTLAELMVRPVRRTPADTDAERLLRSSDAYNAAYDHLYNLLPDCKRGCACQTLWNALLGTTDEPEGD